TVHRHALVDRHGAKERQEMMRRPVSGRLPPFDETRRTANKHAGADGEDALGALRLSPYPTEHVLVFHQRFLTETARYVQHVELRRVAESCIRQELKPAHVSHWRYRFGEDTVSGIREAGEDLERTCEVHLIEPVKCERADLQVPVRPDHA